MGGGDKLFNKRKAKRLSGHGRKKPQRDPYDVVLIVCEGETEEKYFKGLVAALQLNTANVRIPNNTRGSSPRNVVDFAISEYNETKEFDKVFCVIDKDSHSQYDEALDMVRRKKLRKKHSIHAITSVPCFEFWILLHYRMTTQSFYSDSGSACETVIHEVKKYIPKYEKAARKLFPMTEKKLDAGIENAEIVLKHCQSAGTDDPSTKIHELVLYLKKLKQEKRKIGDKPRFF